MRDAVSVVCQPGRRGSATEQVACASCTSSAASAIRSASVSIRASKARLELPSSTPAVARGEFVPCAILHIEGPTAHHPGLVFSFDSQQRTAGQALLHVHEALSRTVNVAVMNEEAAIDRSGPREFAHGASLWAGTLNGQGAMARRPAARWPNLQADDSDIAELSGARHQRVQQE